MKVGTVKGRHPLPVDQYLVKEEISPGEEAYNATYVAAYSLSEEIWMESMLEKKESMDTLPGRQPSVDLYYTGLTEATIGALDGFARGGILVELYRFDSVVGEYVHLSRRPS